VASEVADVAKDDCTFRVGHTALLQAVLGAVGCGEEQILMASMALARDSHLSHCSHLSPIFLFCGSFLVGVV
jgi:hypothetical protein